MEPGLPLSRFAQWNRGLAEAFAATSPAQLAERFAPSARNLLAADSCHVGLYLREGACVTIDGGRPDRWNRQYDRGLFRQDPFFQKFAATRQDFLLPLSSFDTFHFEKTPYYRDFYRPSQTIDEITGVFNLSPGTAGYVTFFRHRGSPGFIHADLVLAEGAGDAIRLVLERLWRLWQTGRRAGRIGGKTGLSAREQQILDLMLEGGCAKSIARRLAISPGTVRNHIKSIYAKLGVHSQVELLAGGGDGRSP
ncbi:response regulator transcription factor [Labrys sp. 22185]|uniref:helix-turn-helix transcriptional regulator n=1 Tax=Labrys sp. 22185 TaxID=3453888 RepID=UPI003F841103